MGRVGDARGKDLANLEGEFAEGGPDVALDGGGLGGEAEVTSLGGCEVDVAPLAVVGLPAGVAVEDGRPGLAVLAKLDRALADEAVELVGTREKADAGDGLDFTEVKLEAVRVVGVDVAPVGVPVGLGVAIEDVGDVALAGLFGGDVHDLPSRADGLLGEGAEEGRRGDLVLIRHNGDGNGAAFQGEGLVVDKGRLAVHRDLHLGVGAVGGDGDLVLAVTHHEGKACGGTEGLGLEGLGAEAQGKAEGEGLVVDQVLGPRAGATGAVAQAGLGVVQVKPGLVRGGQEGGKRGIEECHGIPLVHGEGEGTVPHGREEAEGVLAVTASSKPRRGMISSGDCG